jgi:hypothetical protein
MLTTLTSSNGSLARWRQMPASPKTHPSRLDFDMFSTTISRTHVCKCACHQQPHTQWTGIAARASALLQDQKAHVVTPDAHGPTSETVDKFNAAMSAGHAGRHHTQVAGDTTTAVCNTAGQSMAAGLG